ncbi:MAG TPA: 3-hydroxyacyl-CoA dehydrogenase NAD-binding domain-containing protein [Anaerolineales bacterium]|nr:3-hydroxyacyl-CoA dehydrogenase NAD-binding domain-containing protein [Anaerolineales bacterium]
MPGRGLASDSPIGVIGAGTMGSGIALVALSAWRPVVLVDPIESARARAQEYLHRHLSKPGKTAALDRLTLAADLEALSGCGLVIEAAPENLDLKRDLFRRLESICPPPALLATNTSTLSIGGIASATSTPERVGGLHFFNPAALMPLVEVAAGEQTSEATLATLVAVVKEFGKTPVVARDTPGFIVNRVARPFYGEALRLLAEGIATVDQIDRVVEMAGGFRMGPFRLMDLIGLDVNLAATRSIYEQTFGEPRYRPHPIQARLVEQGRLGRKSGAGFYNYSAGDPPLDREAPAGERGAGLLVLSEGTWASGIAEEMLRAGFTLHEAHGSAPVAGIVAAGTDERLREHVYRLDRALPPSVPLLVQAADATLSEIHTWCTHPERVIGFDGLFFVGSRAATLVAAERCSPEVRRAIEALMNTCGRRAEWIRDGAGLILPRLVAALVNEAAFALMEATADEPTIDLAMRLGANYPAGPLEWGRRLGWSRVVRVMDHLHAELGEDRYRAAPILRRWARGSP